MIFDLWAKTKTDARWSDSHPALNTLVRNFSPCSPQYYCFISSSSCISPQVTLLSHVKTSPSYLQFFLPLSVSFSFFPLSHSLSGVFINYVPLPGTCLLSLCVCIAGIGMDLFIVVTLAAWSLKAALLSRAQTLARSAHFCLLLEHYLPSGAFKSTSAKHHFQESEREREGEKGKEGWRERTDLIGF